MSYVYGPTAASDELTAPEEAYVSALVSASLTSGAFMIGRGAGTVPSVLAFGSANQVVGMNSGASGNEYKTLTAGSNVAITHSANSIEISASALSGVSTATALVTIGNDVSLSGERALTGTSNQIVITDNGANGTVVLSTPQDIATGSSPTFVGTNIT